MAETTKNEYGTIIGADAKFTKEYKALLQDAQTTVAEGLYYLTMHDHREDPNKLKRELANEIETAKRKGVDKKIFGGLRRLCDRAHQGLPLD